MNDFCFDVIEIPNSKATDFDLIIEKDGEPTVSEDLKTAILISLFTDARCLESEIPKGQKSRRGFWGDCIFNESTGSKLWLEERPKLNQDTLNKTKQYAQECLKWLIEDGHANSVDVETFYTDTNVLNIEIIIDQDNRILIEDIYALR